jgi:hypothetical protein
VRQTRELPGWLEALLIAAASRIFSIAVLFGAWKLDIPHQGGSHVDNPWVIWDGEWYRWIAQHGYHAEAVTKTAYGPGYHDFAFFPTWPLLVRALTLDNRLPFDTVAPIAANVLFLIAAISIWSVIERVGGKTVARWGLALFAFSPAAYVFSLAYGEPLFLVFASRFFVAIDKAWSVGTGIRVALFTVGAQLTRITGAALAFASLPDLLKRETRTRGLVVIASSVVAFGAWWTWIALLTGNPTGYMLGTPSWFLNQRPTPIPVGIASLWDAHLEVSVVAVIFIVLLVAGTRWIARQGETRLALFCLACFASTALDTQTTMPRLVAVAFPAFAGLAAILPSTRWRWALLGLFAATQAALAAGAVQRFLVP